MTGDHIDSPPRTQTSSSGVATDLDAGPIWRYGLRALWDALVGGIGLPRGVSCRMSCITPDITPDLGSGPIGLGSAQSDNAGTPHVVAAQVGIEPPEGHR